MFKNTLLFAFCCLATVQSATEASKAASTSSPVVIDIDAQKYMGKACSTMV